MSVGTVSFSCTTTVDCYFSIVINGNESPGLSNSVVIKNIIISTADVPFEPYSNICPITGFTGVEISKTGKNLLKNISSQVSTTLVMIGQTESYESAQKTYLEAGTYTFSLKSRSFKGQMVFGNESALAIGFVSKGTNSLPITVSEDGYYAFWVIAGTGEEVTASDYSEFQVVSGSATAYEPYDKTITVSWQTEAGTVYSGYVDAVMWKLVAEWKSVDLGTLSWTSNGTVDDAYEYYVNVSDKANGTTNMLCSSLKVSSNALLNNIRGRSNSGIVSVVALDATANAFETAMSGVQLVYELATPIVYTLDPQQPIHTLKGVNNIWNSIGNTDVTYRVEMGNRFSAIKQLITGIESSNTATKNYSVNNLLIIGDVLYRVTSAITSGQTITSGTNVMPTTVEEYITTTMAPYVSGTGLYIPGV